MAVSSSARDTLPVTFDADDDAMIVLSPSMTVISRFMEVEPSSSESRTGSGSEKVSSVAVLSNITSSVSPHIRTSPVCENAADRAFGKELESNLSVTIIVVSILTVMAIAQGSTTPLEVSSSIVRIDTVPPPSRNCRVSTNCIRASAPRSVLESKDARSYPRRVMLDTTSCWYSLTSVA